MHAAVDAARPFLEFRVERVLAAADLRSAEGRARAAEAALEVVAEHPDELVRDQYVMDMADRCRIDAARLRERLDGDRPAALDAARTRPPRSQRRRSRRRSGPARGRDDEPLPDGAAGVG